MTEERITPALEACPKCGAPCSPQGYDGPSMIGAHYFCSRGIKGLCDHPIFLTAEAWNRSASPAPEPVAAMEPVAWRPIETAPFDEMVLLYCPNTSPTVSAGVCAEDCGWLIVEYDLMGSNCVPTHWMPLPPPPGEAHRTRAHTEGYEAAVRDVVAWLREAIGDHFADLAEREFKP